MAKVKSPLLSLGARGQIGKSQVYGSWRGVPYTRQHVIPSNPRTAAQTQTRDAFTRLSEMYKRLGALAVAPWNASISGRPLTARNMFTKVNLPALRGASDFTSFVGSPGALGGLPPTSISADPTATPGEIEVTVGSGAEPTGWTLASIVAVAFEDQAPNVAFSQFVAEAQNDTPTVEGDTVVTFAGRPSTLHVVSAWPVWTLPDGRSAYGPSLTDTVTPLA